MPISIIIRINILICIFCLFLPLRADAEVLVSLKSGIKVRGEVLERTEDFIRIMSNIGVEITYFTDEILLISDVPKNRDGSTAEEMIPAGFNDAKFYKDIPAKLPVEPGPIPIEVPEKKAASTQSAKALPKIDIYEVVPELREYDLPAFRGANPNRAKQFFDQGVEAVESGQHMVAKLNFLKSINADPDFADGYYNLGLVCGLLEQFDESVHYLTKAMGYEPESADIYYALGVAYNAMGEINDAQKYFTKAVDLRPDFSEAYYKLGITYASREDYFMARQNLKKALKIEPESLKINFQLGMILAAMGSDTEAIRSFKKAIEIDPDYADAYYNLGVMYAEISQYDKAIEQFQVAVSKGSLNPDAYYNLGMAHLGHAQKSVTIGTLGAYKKARNNLQRAKELYSTETDFETIQRIDEVLTEIPLY